MQTTRLFWGPVNRLRSPAKVAESRYASDPDLYRLWRHPKPEVARAAFWEICQRFLGGDIADLPYLPAALAARIGERVSLELTLADFTDRKQLNEKLGKLADTSSDPEVLSCLCGNEKKGEYQPIFISAAANRHTTIEDAAWALSLIPKEPLRMDLAHAIVSTYLFNVREYGYGPAALAWGRTVLKARAVDREPILAELQRLDKGLYEFLKDQ
ncbi:MAG: hypothetical protein JW873_02315 [Candidatus Saganbacteria bacterium]|nr:hypothetical protein [Candidatus Saganbacteria bacterium]